MVEGEFFRIPLLGGVVPMQRGTKSKEELLDELERMRRRIETLERNERDTHRTKVRLQRERRFLRDLLDLQDRNRKLVAYEIHDGLAQQLTAAIHTFENFDRLRDHDPQQAEKTLARGREFLRETLAEARRVIDGLRPPVLDASGIVEAIDYLVSKAGRPGGPELRFIGNVDFQRLAAPLENALFRIAQESIANVRRHSHSPRAEVRLSRSGDRVVLEVEDWGVGFDPETVDENRFGLEGIRQRAELLDGHATIDSSPGEGTRITVELPLVEGVSTDR